MYVVLARFLCGGCELVVRWLCGGCAVVVRGCAVVVQLLSALT